MFQLPHKLPNNIRLRTLEYYEKISRSVADMNKWKSGKSVKNSTKSAIELSTVSPIWLNFVNLCQIFCEGISEKIQYNF